MDTHDDDWAPREAPMGAGGGTGLPAPAWRDKWAPSGGGPKGGAMTELCRIDDLPDGGARGFEVPGLPAR
jgi:hypothetical protein